MQDLQLENLDALMADFFSGQADLNPVAERYSKEELSAFYRENISKLETLVQSMTPAQVAYRLPGTPGGPDTSGDEAHFDASEIISHLANGTGFHWWGMTRALGHERPYWRRAPEGTAVTGKVK